MKNVWIRLVFVLCTLSALLYVGVGLGCILSNDGMTYPLAYDAPESARIFLGVLLFNVGLVFVLHVLSFIFTGDTTHLECMLAWMAPPVVIAVLSFSSGMRPISEHGWSKGFGLSCSAPSAFWLPVGVIGFIIGVIFNEYYPKLTKTP